MKFLFSLHIGSRPIFNWVLLLLIIPVSALANDSRYYSLYRASEQRCTMIRDTALLRDGDQIYGGPFESQEALRVIRERCPVPFHEEMVWFAVSRKQDCWLVKDISRLLSGDNIWRGNVSRILAEAVLLHHCDEFKIDDGEVVTAEPDTMALVSGIPTDALADYQWIETAVPWVSVLAKPESSIETKEVNPAIALPADWKSLTEFVSIEPEDFASAPGGVRVQLPDSLVKDGENPNNVALAFFEESWSPSGDSKDAIWRLHAVDHNAETGTFDTELHHASVIVAVLIGGGMAGIGGLSAEIIMDEAARRMMNKKESDHFVLHYKTAEIPAGTVDFTLGKLEQSRRLLTGAIQNRRLELVYPSVPVKLDVYFVDLKDSKLYGRYCQGKSGARWIDLNLPKKISNFSMKTLSVTIAHELFHFVQFPYQGYSTFDQAWWGRATGTVFPYSWLNEALSTWIELFTARDPAFVFTGDDPVLDPYVYHLGLRGVKTDKQGYSAGLFVDFLVRRYGIDIIGDILRECTRQVDSGVAGDAYTAVRLAIWRRARILQPGERLFGDMDAVWREFSGEFIAGKNGSTAIDNRGDRKIPYTAKAPGRYSVSENGWNTTWSINVPPLSLVPQASRTFKIIPSERDSDGNALIDCTAEFTPGSTKLFEVATLMYSSDGFGKTAYIPTGTQNLGQLDDKKSSRSFTLAFRKKHRTKFLSFIPVGFGSETAVGSQKTAGSYSLKCELRTKEEVPDFGTAFVSTTAIENYYRTLLNAVAAMKRTPGSRINDVCPSCDDRYRAATNEFAPIAEAIEKLSQKNFDRQHAWREMTDLTSEYYNKRSDHEQEIDEGDRQKISKFVDISSAIMKAHNPCSFSASRAYILLPYLSGDLPVRTSLVVLQCRGDKGPVPSMQELEKRFKRMRKEFSNIAACREATKFIEPFLRDKRDEMLKDVEQLKAKHPWLQ